MRSFAGRVWDVVTEEVDLGDGGVVTRDFVEHTGAVAVLALDDEERVVLVQQYRHPVGAFEWELPAGLLDVDGEPAHLTAARELHEEADLVAGEWHLLLDHYASPGVRASRCGSSWPATCARCPMPSATSATARSSGCRFVACRSTRSPTPSLAGDVHNGTLIIAVLAAVRLREREWTGVRPIDEPWSTRSPGRLGQESAGGAG